MGYSPWCHEESDTTRGLTFSLSTPHGPVKLMHKVSDPRGPKFQSEIFFFFLLIELRTWDSCLQPRYTQPHLDRKSINAC